MEPSAAVREALLTFYERFSAGNVDAFAQSIASWPDAFVIGTGPTEWQDGRDTWIAGYEMQITAIPGIRMQAGNVRAYAEGALGFAADQPSIVLPNGLSVPVRLTAVLRQESGIWKLLNIHFSAGVPDEVLIDLASGGMSEQPSH
jgi:hypothetical protein